MIEHGDAKLTQLLVTLADAHVSGERVTRGRENKRGFVDLRELNRSEIASFQHRANGLFVVKCVNFVWEVIAVDAVASEEAENETSPRLEDAANLTQAHNRITPEIQGVDRKCPVKARVSERNRNTVSLSKLHSARGDRTAISAHRHGHHRFGDVDAANATLVYNIGEAGNGSAVAETDF
jgi:hypothetical protein